jgi:hypothetical protein
VSRAPGPDFVIIGAMKSATSTLHQQLAVQPGVFMSTPKEPNFFSDDAVYARGLDWYHNLFAAARLGDLRGESSTHYTKLPSHPRAVERLVAALGTDLKLIYVMRQPVDRLVSHYIHEWTQGVIEQPLDRAVTQHPELVEYGCYARQLEPWLAHFGAPRILPVFFDSLMERPQHELDRIGAFLGVPQRLRWRPERARENVSLERLRLPRWASLIAEHPPLRSFCRRTIPAAWRERLKARWRMTERPELGVALRAEVERRLDADLERLGGWLGMPLTCSNFAAFTAAADPVWTADADRPS